ncbi:MAG: NfeD family protein [Bacteroidales bacterium]|jgi:membrane-bound ClpP family serine protease|nr:NfeD family protein [Bacteroidales bacterium]
MNIFVILLLIIVGILLLLLEFAVIPGITVAGIGGGLALIAAIYIAFDVYGLAAGILTALFTAVAVPILFKYFFKGRVGRRMMLNSEITASVDTDTDKINAGDRGIALSRLAPMGKALFNGLTVEAKSLFGFLDEGSEIEVVETLKTHVIVKPAEPLASNT